MNRADARVHRAIRTVVGITLLVPLACGSDPNAPPTQVLASIEITFTGASVSAGAVQSMGLVYLDKTGKSITGASGATWTSSNPAIATVDTGGNVRGVALGGPVTIMATAEGKTSAVSLTVIPASVAFTPAVSVLLVGGTVRLAATPLDASLNAISGAGPIVWSVSPTSIATVDSTGLVTALAVGPFSVFATIAGRVGLDQITAGVPSPYDGAWQGLAEGGTVQFNVMLGTVSGFEENLTVEFGITICGTPTLTLSGSAVITNGQFSLSGAGTATILGKTYANGFTAAGTFTSPTTMTGTGSGLAYGPLTCGGDSGFFGALGLGTFSATKQ